MCVGFVPADELVQSRAGGPGSVLVLIGAATGRDGIGGVSVLASRTIEDDAHASRPSVQIGDPFLEKLLIEACLELKEAGLLEGLKDLGGAGLTCAVSEAAAGVRLGADLDLDVVPLREAGMEPFEILTSESQERMLAIVRPEDVEAARDGLPEVGTGGVRGGDLHRGRDAHGASRRRGRGLDPRAEPGRRGARVRPGGAAAGLAGRGREPTTRPPRRPRATWRRRSSACWVRPTWPRSGGRSSSTTRWCRARRWSAPAPTPRSSASRERSGRSRCPRTATAATAASTPTSAPPTRSPSPPATSRASARGRSPSPTA